MKRFFSAVVALVIVTACSQPTANPPARLSGVHTLAVANGLVFVTSTDRSELRVIDSADNDYVRAPNPLEPLAIPVIETPDGIERDVRWVDETERVGQFVYAWRHGGPRISVVGVDPDTSLKEEHVIDVAQPVTALAAYQPEGPSTLYYGYYSAEQTRGVLNRRSVPAPSGEAPVELAEFDNASITAISVIASTGDLVVATRSTVTGSTAGDVFWISAADPTNRVSLRPECNLSGSLAECGFTAPVRALRVDARDLASDASRTYRVWGMLDESSCAGAACSGIEAVNLSFADGAISPTVTRALSSDPGRPMTRITSTGGLFTSLDLSPNARVINPVSGEVLTFGLVGFASSGNGDIVVIDADDVKAVDTITDLPTSAVSSRRAAPGGEPFDGGLGAVIVAETAVRSETIEIVFEGPLTEFQRPDTSSDAGFTLSSELIVTELFPGDLITFAPDAGCGDYVVTAPPVSAADGGMSVIPASPSSADAKSPAQCGVWQVRAGGSVDAGSYAVRGTASGFIGRAKELQPFVYPATSTGGTAPQLGFTLPARPSDIVRGDAYLIEVNANFRPLVLRVNAADSQFQGFFVPGTVVRSSSDDRTYIAYPAANAVLEMDTSRVGRDGTSHEISDTYR